MTTSQTSERERPPRNDLAGERYGSRVISRWSHRKRNVNYWHYTCDCGADGVTSINSLRKSERCPLCGNQSSDHYSPDLIEARRMSANLHKEPLRASQKDWSGYRFGSLQVSHFAFWRSRQAFWVCNCCCGNEVLRRAASLGRRPSASCEDCRFGEGSATWQGCGDLSRSLFTTMRRNASESRGIEWDVSIEYLWKLFLRQEKRCSMSGLDIHFGKGALGKDRTASLDRVDSQVGYIEGNVQWVHRDVNFLKRQYPHDKFVAMCKLVAATCESTQDHEFGVPFAFLSPTR